MSEVTIKWEQRVSGRRVGDVETIERTPFIDACLKAGRAVEEVDETVEKPKKHKPAPKPIVGALAELPLHVMSDDGAPEAV